MASHLMVDFLSPSSSSACIEICPALNRITVGSCLEMKAENCNQAMSKPAQTVEANTKAIENGKTLAEMVNLLRAKVIQ